MLTLTRKENESIFELSNGDKVKVKITSLGVTKCEFQLAHLNNVVLIRKV